MFSCSVCPPRPAEWTRNSLKLVARDGRETGKEVDHLLIELLVAARLREYSTSWRPAGRRRRQWSHLIITKHAVGCAPGSPVIVKNQWGAADVVAVS